MTDTETVDQTPAGPSQPVDIGGWPTWLRRTVIAVVLLGAFAIAAWGASGGRSGTGDDDLAKAVVALSPPDGAQALRQTSVGADLAPGYDGRLTVNGIAVPEEQMEGARDPSTVDPEDLAENGIRPNNRNRVYFKPGPGKVIEEFQNGRVTITLRYFLEGQESTTSSSVTWEIRVD